MISALLVLLIHSAVAGDCTPKNFSAKFGPNHDQRNMGLCTSFGMADQFTFELGKKVSALDIALSVPEMVTYLKSQSCEKAPDVNKCLQSIVDHIKTAGAKPTGELVDKMQDTGLCLEEDLTSEYAYDQKPDFWYSWIENTSLEKRLRDVSMDSGVCVFCNTVDKDIAVLTPKSNVNEIREGISKAIRGKEILALQYLACKKRYKLNHKVQFHLELDSSLIDEALDNNKPSGVGISDSLFMLTEDVKKTFKDQAGNHYVLVIGRRKNSQNQCEYLVRSSWGKDCSIYDPKIAKDCKGGQYWVSEKDLKSRTTDSNYFKTVSN
jgi:hypothetical protein